jgi:hypothetical protein
LEVEPDILSAGTSIKTVKISQVVEERQSWSWNIIFKGIYSVTLVTTIANQWLTRAVADSPQKSKSGKKPLVHGFFQENAKLRSSLHLQDQP